VPQVAVGFAQVGAFWCDVAVVEGEEGHAEQAERLEGDLCLLARLLHRVAAGGVPAALERFAAERIEPGPDEAVPVADGEAQLVAHRATEDDTVGLVEAVAERLVRGRAEGRALVGDRRIDREEAGGAWGGLAHDGTPVGHT
jgi:hypothetical protein